ncbi:hypothetical protein DFJ63DRAFT_313505 [Scheffersomyces coipomensis]|uniref:uncharacterized protein n=1 Tax=Scheffersomyces coipomensis TaxID=1788519 RepID=UPI00315CCA7F
MNVLDLAGTKGPLSYSSRSHTPQDEENDQDHYEDASDELLSTSKKRSKSSHHHDQHNNSTSNGLNKDDIEAYFTNLIAECDELIELVVNDKPLKHTYTEYSRNVELVCRKSSKEQSKLVTKIYAALDQKYKSIHNSIMSDIKEYKDMKKKFPLSLFVIKVSEWEKILTQLSTLFIYLDRTYLISHTRKRPIRQYGADMLMDDEILTGPSIKAFFDKLANYRRDRTIDTTTLIEAGILIRRFLNTYDFAREYNQEITRFSTIKPMNSSYLRYILTEIELEMRFIKACGFDKFFRDQMFNKFQRTWIFRDFNLIVNPNFKDILQSPDLEHEFNILLDYIDECNNDNNYREQMAYQWKRYLINQFDELLKSGVTEKDKSPIINRIIDDYNRYKTMIKVKFRNWPQFEANLKNALKENINKIEYNLVIFSQLSKYVDSYLRNTYNNKPQTQSFEVFYTNVISLFECIRNKFEFLTFYKLDVSKRLLIFKEMDLKYEQELIKGFGEQIGENDDVIGSMKKMINDVIKSREKFNKIIEDIDFSCLVLEKTKWPTVPQSHNTPIMLNAKLQTIIDSIDTAKKEDHKLLDWNYYNFHQLWIKYNIGSVVKELYVNLFQANILLLFNDQDGYDISHISRLTKMSPNLVKRVLNSLSTDKSKILFQDGTQYKLNFGFNDKSTKIRIPYVREREISTTTKVSENQTTSSRDTIDSDGLQLVHEMRQNAYKSQLVGIMKRERKVKVVELFNIAIEALEKNGPVAISDLKTCLESLISGEYIKRVDQDYVEYIP